MPASMTYTNLLADLRSYLERGNVSDTEVYAQLPRLVNLAERDIATKLKILGFLVPMTDVMVAGTSVYTKPSRWRETASIRIGVGASLEETKWLFPRSYEYCRMYWPDTTERDEPEFYSDYDYNHWLIVPTPVSAYPLEANCWMLPALLDTSNETNWLTDHAPNALLYGTLLQCEPYLKNDTRIPTWKDFYIDQLSSLDGQDLQRIIDRTTNRREV